MIDEFRRSATFGADRPAGWVGRVRLKGNEAAVLDDSDGATPRDTQGAIAGNPLSRLLVYQHRDASFVACQPAGLKNLVAIHAPVLILDCMRDSLVRNRFWIVGTSSRRLSEQARR